MERLLLCPQTKLLWKTTLGHASGAATNPQGFLRHLLCSEGKTNSLISVLQLLLLCLVPEKLWCRVVFFRDSCKINWEHKKLTVTHRWELFRATLTHTWENCLGCFSLWHLFYFFTVCSHVSFIPSIIHFASCCIFIFLSFFWQKPPTSAFPPHLYSAQ